MKLSRGSVLLTTLFFISAITVVVYAVYSMSLGTYRLSQRNDYLARAKALADSELEFMYYQVKDAMVAGTLASNVCSTLSGRGICDASASEGVSCTPSTAFTPSNVNYRNTNEAWIVKRSISYDFSASGDIPDDSGSPVKKTGSYYYFTIKVEVISNTAPVGGGIDVKEGRRMSNSVSSIFQYNVFAQGDLEFAPGGNTTINGDIAANGSIYMGTRSTSNTLTLNAYVLYLDGSTFSTSTLQDGTTTLNAPVFGTSQAAQVSTMKQAENLLGGLSATSIALAYGQDPTGYGGAANPSLNGLFGKITDDPSNSHSNYQLQLNNAANNVYRAEIAPPPEAVYSEVSHGTDTTAEYPDVASGSLSTVHDDPSVADLRTYNKAGLIVTVHADGSATTFTQVVNGVKTDATSTYTSGSVISQQTTMFDPREGKTIAVTEIDVAHLKTTIDAHYSGFNGLLYVYLANGNSTEPAAIRLINGATTPGATRPASSSGTGAWTPTGFSVATNGGLYVKGDYNTTTSDGTASGLVDSTTNAPKTDAQLSAAGQQVNPAMLMGDAVTVLSSSWSDAADTVTADPNTTIGARKATSGTTTIGAGILTGNVTAKSDGTYEYSGGGQNLVRFIEDWYNGTDGSGGSVNFYGSIGRLFQSTQFTGKFLNTDTGVFFQPRNRSYTFNDNLVKNPPPYSPTITKYSRGIFFTW